MKSNSLKFKNFEILKKELSGVKKNVLLKNHTTFRIGGPAEYFYEAKTEEDLIKAVSAAKKIKMPFFILGGGSNLLVSDKGFNGIAIKVQIAKLKAQNCGLKLKTIDVGAGVMLSEVVNFSVKNGLTGIEWAAGIPGTLGGAIRGNAGAFNEEMKDAVEKVKVLEIKNEKLKIKTLKNKQCYFGYRDSVFKSEKNLIVISAELKLKKENKKKIQLLINDYLAYRREKQPLSYPSAGSVFKNCDVKKVPPNTVKKFFDKIKKDPFPVIPAALFILGAGLKGKKIGDAQISEKHVNFIINLGKAKGEDVKQLINFVKKEVKKKFGAELEEEIQYLGFRNHSSG